MAKKNLDPKKEEPKVLREKLTLTIRPELKQIAKEQAELLGYPSISRYFEFLIEADKENPGIHVIVRTAEGLKHHSLDSSQRPTSSRRLLLRAASEERTGPHIAARIAELAQDA